MICSLMNVTMVLEANVSLYVLSSKFGAEIMISVASFVGTAFFLGISFGFCMYLVISR